VVRWLAENSGGGAGRRLRLSTDKVIYRPGQPVRVSARAYDDKLEETSRYRLVARLRPPKAAGGAAPLGEALLAPRPDDRTYEGELTTPPLRQVPASSDNPLVPLRLLELEVAALDRDKVVAQATLDVQVLDDPAELENPQPDPGRLEEVARGSGGQVLHSAEDLARLVVGHPSTPGEVVVHKAPAWDRPWLWLVLLTLLAAEWVLRRWWGLA
jgi:hypothetical protein